MGCDIAALLKLVEQRDPGCIISVSSPGPGEDATCTDSDLTLQGVYFLGWRRLLSQTCVESVAWLVTLRAVSAQSDQAAWAVLQIQPSCHRSSCSPKNCSCPTIICRSRKSSFVVECQDHALQDYLEASLMLQYNKWWHVLCTFHLYVLMNQKQFPWA